ncbi:polysaccharide export outer membrane protein [Bradyrhizobium sp. USDA 4472]
MPVARAFRWSILAASAALNLGGCMQTTGSVAYMPPRPDLDTMAYGQPYSAPQPAVVANNGGGAIDALANSFAAGPAPVPVAYAAPMVAAPVRYDASYHLDAGDKLRVVVYGQEGLTNSYAIDAGGSITMPLIGAVPARGRTTAGLAGEIAARLRNGYIREPSVAVEIESYRPFFILGEVAAPGQYPLRAQHDGRERGRDRRRLLAARQARRGHRDSHRSRWRHARCRAARHARQPRRHRVRGRALVLDAFRASFSV